MCVCVTRSLVPETMEREFTEKIHQQSDLIARLKRNVTRLQHKLDELQTTTLTDQQHSKRATTRERRILTIYMITPTYARWTQKADLTRSSQTLMHVPNFHWILVEDAEKKTELVTKFLQCRSDVLKSTHLNVRTEESRR